MWSLDPFGDFYRWSKTSSSRGMQCNKIEIPGTECLEVPSDGILPRSVAFPPHPPQKGSHVATRSCAYAEKACEETRKYIPELIFPYSLLKTHTKANSMIFFCSVAFGFSTVDAKAIPVSH